MHNQKPYLNALIISGFDENTAEKLRISLLQYMVGRGLGSVHFTNATRIVKSTIADLPPIIKIEANMTILGDNGKSIIEHITEFLSEKHTGVIMIELNDDNGTLVKKVKFTP